VRRSSPWRRRRASSAIPRPTPNSRYVVLFWYRGDREHGGRIVDLLDTQEALRGRGSRVVGERYLDRPGLARRQGRTIPLQREVGIAVARTAVGPVVDGDVVQLRAVTGAKGSLDVVGSMQRSGIGKDPAFAR
jgi:hypothetical protein